MLRIASDLPELVIPEQEPQPQAPEKAPETPPEAPKACPFAEGAAKRLRAIQAAGEDFEWYPTTDEIIKSIVADLAHREREWHSRDKPVRVLDVGAGDGRVLMGIAKGLTATHTVELSAIEKSKVHLQHLPIEVRPIGTDFDLTPLFDKGADVVFSNPPYQHYEQWAFRVLQETRAALVYLVLPRRWHNSDAIAEIITARQLTVEKLGTYNFTKADRPARCTVEVLAFHNKHSSSVYRGRTKRNPDVPPPDDPFDAFLKRELHLENAVDVDEVAELQAKLDRIESEVQTGLVQGRGRIDVLCDNYNRQMQDLFKNFRGVASIDPTIRAQLGVEIKTILNTIRSKIRGLKGEYWTMLFESLQDLKSRFATKQRAEFVKKLSVDTPVDFTADNVYATVIWQVSHCNLYFDQQIVDLFLKMSEKANAVAYKSNQRVWTNEDWRYRHVDDLDKRPTHYQLEYRQVLHRIGGLGRDWYSKSRDGIGLSEGASTFLGDLVVVANNLGFPCGDNPNAEPHVWRPGHKANVLRLKDGTPLARVRAFKNRNLWLQLNPRIMLAINVAAGRLLGWLKDKPVAEVAEELHVDTANADALDTIERLSAPAAWHLGGSDLIKRLGG